MAYDLPLARALEVAGGPTALSRQLGIVPSAVTQWSRVPAKWARRIEEITGIPRHDLRPDLWDAPTWPFGAATQSAAPQSDAA